MTASKHKKIKASDFDAAFEEGDVSDYLDLKSAKLHHPVQRISIDFPKNILKAVDMEAAKIGVTRTALIKMWVADHLSQQRAKHQK